MQGTISHIIVEMLECVCVVRMQGTISHIISVREVNARSRCHDAYDFVFVLHTMHNRFRIQITIVSGYNAQSTSFVRSNWLLLDLAQDILPDWSLFKVQIRSHTPLFILIWVPAVRIFVD